MGQQTTPLGWTVRDWLHAYRAGASPHTLLRTLLESVRAAEMRDGRLKHGSVWIELASDEQLAMQVEQLSQRGDPVSLPLYGVPFAVKDNIDVAGFATTAACPAFAYEPQADAEVVRLLRAAGAIVFGKTNLDQFATGLVGTRSPYGAVANTFDADRVSGGSSSGSAVAVARGYVAFSLGTDTAGSGRVPAGFNHIVGLKPSKGLLSIRGVVPACRSLDCVSIFTQDALDAERVFAVAAQFDENDAFARVQPALAPKAMRRLGIPIDPPWFGDATQRAAYEHALARAEALGCELVPTDFGPLFELAALLYQGPWVAERYVAVGEFIEQNPDAVDPVVKGIILGGRVASAAQAFAADYRRMELQRRIRQMLTHVDAFFVPTTPRFPTHADIAAEPVQVNSQLGTYTNFVNLADLSAIAIPANLRSDGLPFGVTLIAPAFSEPALLAFASHWQATLRLPSAPVLAGACADDGIVVAVVGAHLTGMPLNHQLTSRGAVLLEETRSAPKYQLFALADTTPPKPGLVRVSDARLAADSSLGNEIIVELWRLDAAAFGHFVAEIPRPLGIGTLELRDGRLVKGFICEPEAIATAIPISEFGGWRAYVASLAKSSIQ